MQIIHPLQGRGGLEPITAVCGDGVHPGQDARL